jgi:hypothetical protein
LFESAAFAVDLFQFPLRDAASNLSRIDFFVSFPSQILAEM